MTRALNGSPLTTAPPGAAPGPRQWTGIESLYGMAMYDGPFPPSNAAIPVPAISALRGRDIAARQPWVRVKRKRTKRSNFNKWGLV